MRSKMETHSYEAEKRVRDIQRATRRQFSAEEKREVAMTREEAVRYVSYQLDDALLASSAAIAAPLVSPSAGKGSGPR
jgi:hypothetical protein